MNVYNKTDPAYVSTDGKHMLRSRIFKAGHGNHLSQKCVRASVGKIFASMGISALAKIDMFAVRGYEEMKGMISGALPLISATVGGGPVE